MPKLPNQLETVTLRLSTTKAVVDYLKELVATGLYGRHHTEAAERIISRGIEQLLQDGTIQKHGPNPGPDHGGRRMDGKE
jgi:hypothetical protein